MFESGFVSFLGQREGPLLVKREICAYLTILSVIAINNGLDEFNRGEIPLGQSVLRRLDS